MTAILLLLLFGGAVAALVCLVAPVRVMRAVTVCAGVASLALAIALVPTTAQRTVSVGAYLKADPLSTVFLLATGFLYAATAVFSVGYLRAEARASGFPRYARRFYVGVNLWPVSDPPPAART